MSSVPTLAKSLEWLARSFADASQTGKPLCFDPAMSATFGIIVDMTITRLEEFDQLIASDEALRRKVRVLEADIAALEQKARLAPSPESMATVRGCFEADRRAAEAREAPAPSNVVDMAGRPAICASRPSDEGGAA